MGNVGNQKLFTRSPFRGIAAHFNVSQYIFREFIERYGEMKVIHYGLIVCSGQLFGYV